MKWSKHDRKRVNTYRTGNTSPHMTFPWSKPSQRASWSVSPILRLTASLGSKIDTLKYKRGFCFLYFSSWLKTSTGACYGLEFKEHIILSFSSGGRSVFLNMQDRERAICTGLSTRTQHLCRIILRRDFTLLRAQLSNADFYRNHKTGNVLKTKNWSAFA
jgi:hypothetical protein